jgi:hypothetical protein
LNQDDAGKYEPLVDGFLPGVRYEAPNTRGSGAPAIGRPADVLQLQDGSVLISDDSGNLRLTYSRENEVMSKVLEQIAKQSNGRIKTSINPGEGAFYGPKFEYVLRDAIGRDWQCGTTQVDFNLPERFGAFYIDSDSEKKTPVMIHRAAVVAGGKGSAGGVAPILPPSRRARPPRQPLSPSLERIVIRRNRFAVSSDRVNPLYLKEIDQIHTVDGSPQAIPSNRDLI